VSPDLSGLKGLQKAVGVSGPGASVGGRGAWDGSPDAIVFAMANPVPEVHPE
jgi:malic enzyme